MGNWTNLCKNFQIWNFTFIRPVGAELLRQTDRQPDWLTDWLAGTWWSRSSLFGMAFWKHEKKVGLWDPRALCVCVCVFVRGGGFTVVKPIDHFSWNLVWTLSHWSHTNHHNFSELRALDDNQQCGSCVKVWGRRGCSSTIDCRLLKLCVMVYWGKIYAFYWDF